MIWPFSKFYYLHSSIYIIYIYQQIDFRFFLFFIIIYIYIYYTILYYILYYILYTILYTILYNMIILYSIVYSIYYTIIYYAISTIFHPSIHSFSSPFLYNHQTIISFSIFYILPLFYIAYTIRLSTLLYISITFHNLFKTISNLYILFYIFIIITIHFINIQPIPYSVSTISYSIIRYSTKEEFSLTNYSFTFLIKSTNYFYKPSINSILF